MSKSLPSRAENYSEWYNELVKRADLAENSAVRGCMIIKPHGYALWEMIQSVLDQVSSCHRSLRMASPAHGLQLSIAKLQLPILLRPQLTTS